MVNIFLGNFDVVLKQLLKKISIDLVLVEDKLSNKKVIKFCQKKKIKYLLVKNYTDILKTIKHLDQINLCFVASFSLLLKKDFIKKCRHIVNFHLGDVEFCRGRHPLPTAILHKHKNMGITIHLIDSQKIDAGPILAKVLLPINYSRNYKENERQLLRALKLVTELLIDDYSKKGKFITYNWQLKKSIYFKPLNREILEKMIKAPNLFKISVMKKIIISQPRYLPAINYLQRLYFVDLFILLDNVQRQSRGWENRNKILFKGKERWVTIPITSSSREIIKRTKINGDDWIQSHQDLITTAYCQHPYYDKKMIDFYYKGVKESFKKHDGVFVPVIVKLILNACQLFGFQPKIAYSSQYPMTDGLKGVEKLLAIYQQVKGPVYISGANGREYGAKEIFKNSGIKVLFHDFKYPRYKQFQQKTLIPWLSFFDPLFNLGLEKIKKMIYKRPNLSKN